MRRACTDTAPTSCWRRWSRAGSSAVRKSRSRGAPCPGRSRTRRQCGSLSPGGRPPHRHPCPGQRCAVSSSPRSARGRHCAGRSCCRRCSARRRRSNNDPYRTHTAETTVAAPRVGGIALRIVRQGATQEGHRDRYAPRSSATPSSASRLATISQPALLAMWQFELRPRMPPSPVPGRPVLSAPIRMPYRYSTEVCLRPGRGYGEGMAREWRASGMRRGDIP